MNISYINYISTIYFSLESLFLVRHVACVTTALLEAEHCGVEEEFDSSFEYRSLDETDWVICDQALNHANDDWNWSIASDPAGSCTRLGGGDAFLLRGGDEHGAEAAERLYGLKSFFGAENWIAVSVYVRRTP